MAVPAPIQENHVPEQSTPPTEEAVAGEVYNPPENGDVLIVEEEVPVAEVVDEVEDDTQMVVESSAKIEELPKKSYASIVSGYEQFNKIELFVYIASHNSVSYHNWSSDWTLS